MKFKPFCRLCGICGLSIAVVLGEEREHTHVEARADHTVIQSNNIVVVATSGAFIPYRR